ATERVANRRPRAPKEDEAPIPTPVDARRRVHPSKKSRETVPPRDIAPRLPRPIAAARRARVLAGRGAPARDNQHLCLGPAAPRHNGNFRTPASIATDG